MFKSEMWKRKLEVVKGTAPFWPFISNLKTLNVVHFFGKFTKEIECLTDNHLQRNIFIGLWFTLMRGSPHFYPLKMNRVSNQLIFKSISAQKFSILVLKYKLLKIFQNWALTIFKKSGAILV